MANLSKTQVHELLRVLDLLTDPDPEMTKERIFNQRNNLFNTDKFTKIIQTLHSMKGPNDSDSDEYKLDILSNIKKIQNP